VNALHCQPHAAQMSLRTVARIPFSNARFERIGKLASARPHSMKPHSQTVYGRNNYCGALLRRVTLWNPNVNPSPAIGPPFIPRRPSQTSAILG